MVKNFEALPALKRWN